MILFALVRSIYLRLSGLAAAELLGSDAWRRSAGLASISRAKVFLFSLLPLLVSVAKLTVTTALAVYGKL